MKSDSQTVIRPVKALSFIFRLAPGSFLIMMLMELSLGIVSLCSVILTRKIFSLVSGGYTRQLMSSLLLYGVSLILCAAYSVWYIRYHVQFETILKFEEQIRKKLHGKSRRISNEALEMPQVYAYLRQADSARQNLFRYVQIYLDLTFACVQGLLITLYLSAFEGWFLILLPLSVLPVGLDLLYKAKLWRRDFETSSQCQREEEAYSAAMTDSTACKESRITGAAAFLMEKWNVSRTLRDQLAHRKSKTIYLLHLLTAPITVAGTAGGLLASAILLYRGRIDFPTFTAGVAAYGSLVSVLKSLADSMENEAQFRRMIQPFFRYWNLPERGGSEETESLQGDIRLEDVSFRYPGAKKDAISHLSLTISQGETLAIVGENGAGKTTLANLILGLYQPTEGKIFYGDQELSLLQEASLHRYQSAVMQSFVRYQTTAGDNIALGNPRKQDASEIETRLREIFPQGEIRTDTPLGKEFGGRELSGGQWQQLSCARGFYKDADFLLLDEPTSAIDPLKERALVDRFHLALKGKTGLIITHRLGAVSLANHILVLEQGKIAQYGTLQVLLEDEGIFRTLWESQAEAYQEG